jgi:hypothetical protein
LERRPIPAWPGRRHCGSARLATLRETTTLSISKTRAPIALEPQRVWTARIWAGTT